MEKKIRVKVPDGVHFKVSRNSDVAIDFLKMLRSHILLPIRATFGRFSTFNWLESKDWISFCNGEVVVIEVVLCGEEKNNFQSTIQVRSDGAVIVKSLEKREVNR
jgi:hypothetical protein